MSTVVKDLGAVSAYAYAVEKGYTGTEAEFAELMADYAEVGQRAEDAADSALESKTAAQTAATTATNKASEATTAAQTATAKAAEAQADADAAALDASQAMSAASTATTKATEATTAAATAVSAKDDAVSANTAAQSAKTAAQTAQTGAETAAASVQSSAAQIQTNADDISELKEDLTATNAELQEAGFIEVKSANLLNPSDVLLDTAMGDNGSTWSDSNSATSGYIEVKANTKYSCFAKSGSTIICLPAPRVCAFDANKEFVEKIGSISYSASNVSYVTTSGTAKYIRMYWTKVNYQAFGTVMVAETDGTTMPTEIVEYGLTHEMTKLKNWWNKKWTAIGDSLTERNERTTKNYCDYISELTGINVINMGLSGSGYMKKHDVNAAFYNRVANVPTDSDVVTIFGSLNDIGGTASLGTVNDTVSDGTIFGYVNGTIDALYNAFPAVNLGIIAPTPWKSSEPWNANNLSSEYCEGLRQICYNRGIPYLDLYHCSNLRPWDSTARDLFYSKDVTSGVNSGCHPDESGHLMFAPKVKNFLESLLM